jgi:hypothetical protein
MLLLRVEIFLAIFSISTAIAWCERLVIGLS